MKNRTKKQLLRGTGIFLLLLALLGSALPLGAVSDPEISHSEASLIYCVEADRVLWSENPDMTVYPAALVKLMTAILAVESADRGEVGFEEEITVSASVVSASTGNTANLKTGEKIRFRDLIGVMVLVGANDAALAIAERVGGTVEEFVGMMNEKAGELEMENTVYTNPTGLHDGRMTTTANDLLILARYASRNTFLTELFGQERITVDATNLTAARAYGTRNYLVSQRVSTDYYLSMANGMICGSTSEAGFCIIATAQNNGVNYIAIVLGADTTTVQVSPEKTEYDSDGNVVAVTPAQYKYIMNGFVESALLLKWARDNYEFIRAVDRATPICQIPVRLARSVDSVTLLPEQPIEIYVPKDIDREKDIELRWELPEPSLTAPIKAGTRAGTLTVLYKGEVIGEVPLIVNSNIESSGALTLIDRAGQLVSTPFFRTVLLLIAVGAVVYIFATAIGRYRKKAAAKKEYIRKNRYLK